MPMPNRQMVGGELYRYGYQGEFAETDPETGRPSFERRLYDTRLGKWLRPDDIKRSDESPYMAMGNNPILYGDPDGRDIIILGSSKSVYGFGHAAVLIGNDKDGWRYVSKNGTEAHGIKGTSYNPNLGNVKYDSDSKLGDDFRGTGLTANEVISIVNQTYRDKQNLPVFDVAGKISSHPMDDYLAFSAATKQAISDYNLFNASCLNVCKDAVNSVNNSFFGYNKNLLVPKGITPSSWVNEFNFFNMFNSFHNNFEINNTRTGTTITGAAQEIGIEY